MPIDNKFERCEPDDPNRCQCSGAHGQCPFKAQRKNDSEYFQYCPRHNGSVNISEKTKNIRNYRLTKFQARMEELADNEGIKSLREEIGITRMMLEEILNSCQDGTDIIMASNKISDTVTKIEKLVSSCHRLEQSSGSLLDKPTLMRLADAIVNIIGKHIVDEAAISQIATEIVDSVLKMKTPEKE